MRIAAYSCIYIFDVLLGKDENGPPTMRVRPAEDAVRSFSLEMVDQVPLRSKKAVGILIATLDIVRMRHSNKTR